MRKTIEIFFKDNRTLAKVDEQEFNLGEVKKISTEFHPYPSDMIEKDRTYFVYENMNKLVEVNGQMRDLANSLGKKYYFEKFPENEAPAYVLILDEEETININIL